MENPDKSPKELVEDLYTLFASFKKRMEDPNYIQIENSIQTMVKNQEELKTEVKELKRQLLNPFDGVIVETKKNTEARQDADAKKNEDFKVKDWIASHLTTGTSDPETLDHGLLNSPRSRDI